MTNAAVYRPCPACQATDNSPWPDYSPDQWQVVQCASCGLTYLRNPVAYEALEEDFAWEKTYEAKQSKGGSTPLSGVIRKIRHATGLTHSAKANRLRRWFKDGHVLDIGCGLGGRIVAPMTPYGIELSKGLHAQADQLMQARGGYCVHGAGAQAIWDFPERKFDGIIMHSYLEHETDVMAVLTGSHRALKDDGAIFIRVPNFGSLNRKVIGKTWCGFRYPDHVNYFTLDTLTDTVARAGFALVVLNRLRLAVDDNIHALLRKA